MKRAVALLCLLVFCFSNSIVADEGMWLFNAFPKDKVKAKYGFEPTQEWLDHVRLSSVRFNNGGSGSFVSPDGLTFTNHHVGSDCIQEISSEGKDYLKTGFYAKSQAEEAKCPELELNVLQSIEDVTAKVHGAAKPGASAAEAAQAQRAAMSAIEKECVTRTGQRCDVVTFYSGGMYHLYQYKKYTDVRLVFAPEIDIAFFGGDPDNFEYPRYDLDVAFFRIYENDKPVKLTHYLTWSSTGVKENDLIFVSGHPGSTGRLKTAAELELLRDVTYPFSLKSLERRLDALQKFSAQSEENRRRAQDIIFSYANSFKAQTGYMSGLRDPQLMARKRAEEQKLRAAVDADPAKKAEFGSAWAEIEKAVQAEREIFLPLTFLERRAGFRGQLAGFARFLVRAAEEKPKPNSERMREFRDSGLPSVEAQLFSTAPIYKDTEQVLFDVGVAEMKEAMEGLPAGVTDAMLAGAISKTRLDDVAVRKQLYAGGKAAVDASDDPLIVLMRAIDAESRAVRKRFEDEVDAVARRNGALIAKARFATGGASMPPDATFTLRLSYGPVKGYIDGGKTYPYFTTIGGAFEHEQKHGAKPPYKLPASWTAAKSKLDLKTPLNVVSTADIIGGNSGSPVVSTDGKVVGIIFDGNIPSLPWNFEYSDKVGRSIHVDSRGIIEALRTVYGAKGLADELTGKAAKAPAD